MNTQNLLFSVTGLALLAACGGGSTSIATNQFVLSSNDANFAGTGLRFATDETGQVLSDLAAGDSFQVVVAGYENLQGESVLTPTLTTETVTLVDDGFGSVVAEFNYRGETLSVTINNEGEINSLITLTSGQDIVVRSQGGGNFADVYEIFTFEDFEESPVDGQPNAHASFVLGFETDPATVAGLTGTATYSGNFGGSGGLFTKETDADTGDITETLRNRVIVSGDVDLSVSFDDALVNAELTGSLDNAADPDFSASLTDAPLVGNSFGGDLALVCLNGFTCTSDSQMGGAFYGPDADEAVGLIAFDVDGVDQDGNEIRFVSGAYFGAVDQDPQADPN